MTLTLGAGELDHQEVTTLLLALAILLGSARLLGEVVRRFKQPALLGEILAGILLGPSLLGHFYPEWSARLFPVEGDVPVVFGGLSTLAIVMFLLVAGMEVDLSKMWRQGRAALSVSFSGILIPFGLGFIAAYLLPRHLGWEPTTNGAGIDQRMIFALFFATAMSISALPVIAKTLMDLNLYRTDMGMIVIASAIFNDLVGWIIFAIILGLIGAAGTEGVTVGETVMWTLGFAVGMLTVGRWLIHKSLPWLQAHLSWPGGVIGLSMAATLACAAFTESIGIHAIFGSFIFGIALGDTPHLREQTRATINQFISYFFAPLFFASIGLRVDFIRDFDTLLVLVVLVIACVGKVVGCGLAARAAGMEKREAWALGFGMNARGTMEIILGLLALEYGLIGDRLFVALVVMALVTSVISGPMMERILHRPKPRRFIDFVAARCYLPRLHAASRTEAIAELASAAAKAAGMDALVVGEAVMAREKMMATGLAGGVAIPHARIAGLRQPVVAVGVSEAGIDFEAPDNSPATLIFLIVTPTNDAGAQLEILADIAHSLADPQTRDRLRHCPNFTEFLACLKSAPSRQQEAA